MARLTLSSIFESVTNLFAATNDHADRITALEAEVAALKASATTIAAAVEAPKLEAPVAPIGISTSIGTWSAHDRFGRSIRVSLFADRKSASEACRCIASSAELRKKYSASAVNTCCVIMMK